MNAPTLFAVCALALSAGLAGCTGSFDVDQTEPFRVQLEGGPETVTVSDTDTEAKRVVVETCGDVEADSCDVEQVDVQFEVKQVSSGPCKILVTIQDEDGQTILSRVIDVSLGDGGDDDGGDVSGNASTNTTSGNTTTSGDASDSSAQTVIQNIIVDVRGSKNIVVVTQAQEGSADINIQAIKASGNADVDADQDTTGSDPSGTMTATSTSSTNSTTSSP